MLNQLNYFEPKDNQRNCPFNLKWLKQLNTLSLRQPLTFLVGRNGIGKSTLLQGIAIQAQIPPLTNDVYEKNTEYQTILKLANALKLQWSVKTKCGFFFRADDYISFVRQNKALQEELQNELDLLDKKGVNPLAFERQPYQNSLTALKQTYPTELHHLSHGQSFLELFKSRLTPNSLYLLDEPEISLSPQNQLTLLYMIDQEIKRGSQFIIATHSTILTSHPKATIYSITENSIEPIHYDEMENVVFMKSFMASPERFIHYTLT